MSTQIQYRRGTQAQNDGFTGVLAEITVDTTNNTLRVHNGVTQGGFALVGATATQTLTNKTLTSPTITTATLSGTQTGSANLNLTGFVSASGNVTGNYLLGNAYFVTGLSPTRIYNGTSEVNIGASNGNANITIGGTSNVLVAATTGVFVTGLFSATGNITGGNILGGANVNATTHTGTTVSVTGNIDGGNLRTVGQVSATGNVTGNYLLGNAYFVTGLSPTRIYNGTSEVNIGASNGNANITIGGTSNVLVAATTGIFVTGLSSVTGNVTGGNINTAGVVSATGGVTGGGITLNANTISSTGSTLTIDPAASGVTGTVVIAGNLTVQGTTTTYDSTTVTINDLVFTTANNAATASAANGGGIEVGPAGSAYATWLYDQPNSRWTTALGINATGNVTGGNLVTAGLVTVTGNVNTAAGVLATGNVTGGNLNLSGNIVDSGALTLITGSSGNVSLAPNGTNMLVATTTGANIAGTLNATGNANVGNLGAATVVATTLTGTLSTAAQTNITSLGTLTSLAVSGNLSSLTASGNTNTTQVATTAFVVGQAGGATPGAVGSASVGTSLRYAREDHTHSGVTSITTSSGLSTNTSATGAVSITNTGVTSAVAGTGISVSAATGAVTITNSGVTSVNGGTGAITNIAVTTGTLAQFAATTSSQLAGVISDETGSGSLVFATSPTLTTPNIGAATGTSLNISTGTLTCGSIVNANANGVGNIGSSTTYFNTVFAKATSAQYADVAEKYQADDNYPVGTVLVFGGDHEVTTSTESCDTRIAGTVSENPAYIMNGNLQGNNVAVVALLGRVPCKVIGDIRKGDVLVSSHVPGTATSLKNMPWAPGCVIGKALEDYNSQDPGVIEIVVGRF